MDRRAYRKNSATISSPRPADTLPIAPSARGYMMTGERVPANVPSTKRMLVIPRSDTSHLLREIPRQLRHEGRVKMNPQRTILPCQWPLPRASLPDSRFLAGRRRFTGRSWRFRNDRSSPIPVRHLGIEPAHFGFLRHIGSPARGHSRMAGISIG